MTPIVQDERALRGGARIRDRDDVTPERWRQISQIYHEALARDPATRVSFVADAAASDAALRAEVP
jgi:hypothetical protein